MANSRAATKAERKPTRAELFAKLVGKPSAEAVTFIQDKLVPLFNPAVKRAEGNPRNFGVLSEQVSSPKQANKVLNKSIRNNYLRWLQAGQPGRFVDFMQMRWAPIGAKNDPKNLNVNWAGNVRRAILDKVGQQEYDRLRKMRLVLADQQQTMA